MVDEEVLQNVSKFVARRYSKTDFVKLVDADWEHDPEDDDDYREAINGCTNWDVGWMRVDPRSIHVDLYLALDGDSLSRAWGDQFYTRPPDILRY